MAALTVSRNATAAIASTDKRLEEVANATHRSFDSTYCAQLQSAGAAFDTNHNGKVERGEELANARPHVRPPPSRAQGSTRSRSMSR